MKELSEFDKTLLSYCITVFNEALQDEHLGEPIRLQKALDNVKKFVRGHEEER